MVLEKQVEKRGGDEESFLRELGDSARQLQGLLAWKHLYDNVLRLRESFVQKLIAGEDGASENRRAIVVMDSILKLPAKFVEDGRNAKES